MLNYSVTESIYDSEIGWSNCELARFENDARALQYARRELETFIGSSLRTRISVLDVREGKTIAHYRLECEHRG